MSADTVDDLQSAEDFAGTLAFYARDLLLFVRLLADKADHETLPTSFYQLKTAVDYWDTSYCRPTCNPNDDGPHDEACEQGDCCGCPCRSRSGERVDTIDGYHATNVGFEQKGTT